MRTDKTTWSEGECVQSNYCALALKKHRQYLKGDNFFSDVVQVDVSDPKQVQEVKKDINADLGIVNILVNNAGLMPKTSLREGDTDSIRRVMDVNILSHFWVKFMNFHSTHFTRNTEMASYQFTLCIFADHTNIHR